MAKGKYERWLAPEGLTLLRGWTRDGLTDKEIAARIGVARQTLYDWQSRYPDISDAMRRGREVINYAVEDCLIQRVTGYDAVETRTEYDPEGNVLREIRQVRHVPPDTSAIEFWLKNRMRDRYRDQADPADGQMETGCVLLPEADDPEGGGSGETADDG